MKKIVFAVMAMMLLSWSALADPVKNVFAGSLLPAAVTVTPISGGVKVIVQGGTEVYAIFGNGCWISVKTSSFQMAAKGKMGSCINLLTEVEFEEEQTFVVKTDNLFGVFYKAYGQFGLAFAEPDYYSSCGGMFCPPSAGDGSFATK